MEWVAFYGLFAFLVLVAIPTLVRWLRLYVKVWDGLGFLICFIILTFAILFAFSQFMFTLQLLFT